MCPLAEQLRQCQRSLCPYPLSELLLSCFYWASSWLRWFLWGDRWQEVFAPSSLWVWSQMPGRNLQIRVSPRGFLHKLFLITTDCQNLWFRSTLSWGKAGCSSLSICLLCFGYIRCCSIGAVCRWISLFFHTSRGISSRPAAFLFLISISTTSSSCVNCLSLMTSWLLTTFVIGLSVNLGDFPSRFLKCSFHICIRSS